MSHAFARIDEATHVSWSIELATDEELVGGLDLGENVLGVGLFPS